VKIRQNKLLISKLNVDNQSKKLKIDIVGSS